VPEVPVGFVAVVRNRHAGAGRAGEVPGVGSPWRGRLPSFASALLLPFALALLPAEVAVLLLPSVWVLSRWDGRREQWQRAGWRPQLGGFLASGFCGGVPCPLRDVVRRLVVGPAMRR